MRTSQIIALALVVGMGAAGCDDTGELQSPTEPTPRIEAATATYLTGTVATDITPAPTVRAVDSQGGPVQGIRVSFQLGDGGGTITNAWAETDVHGLATVGKWTLGPRAGTFTLTAQPLGTAQSPGPAQSSGPGKVVFTARAEPGPVAQITTVRGDGQIGRLGDTLLRPLEIGIADSFSNPITGAPVTFTVIAGDGSIANSSVLTDSDGLAESGAWTLGPTPGVQQVRAESGITEVIFSAFAYSPPSVLLGPITFVSDRDGDSEIYAINADGSGLEQLTVNGANDDAPAWSPDGGLIAFVSDRDGTPSIYVMTADGSYVMRRTTGGLLGEHELAWSPSGTALAFTLHDRGWFIATLHDDARVTILTRERGVNSQPSWSPDGQQLAFVSDREVYDLVYNIYTMDADGSRQQQRTGTNFEEPYFLHPSWSPDGSMIAFVHGRLSYNFGEFVHFTIAIMTANGEFIRDVAWAGDIPWMELQDPGSLAWSPDGGGIAYTFVDCDLVLRSSCSKVRSVKYVSLDGSQPGTIVENAHSPSWRR